MLKMYNTLPFSLYNDTDFSGLLNGLTLSGGCSDGGCSLLSVASTGIQVLSVVTCSLGSSVMKYDKLFKKHNNHPFQWDFGKE